MAGVISHFIGREPGTPGQARQRNKGRRNPGATLLYKTGPSHDSARGKTMRELLRTLVRSTVQGSY